MKVNSLIILNIFVFIYIFFIDALSFSRLLGSIKSGKSIDGNEASQFDERTEESSAEQYFQVENLL
jgi:hypothetical protein